MKNDLLHQCLEGWDLAHKDNPYLFSSDSWMAFQAGRRIVAMCRPVKCRKSRGYSIVIETSGGSTCTLKFTGKNLETITMERV